jgi:hypothetical protein
MSLAQQSGGVRMMNAPDTPNVVYLLAEAKESTAVIEGQVRR